MASVAEVLGGQPDARFIFLTLLIAYLIYLLPTSGSLMLLRPDLPLIVLLYWCVHKPRSVGYSVGFLFGLLVDIADASVLGQHALAYAVAIYLTLALRVRILKFGLWQQALHILPMLLASQVVLALSHLFLPAVFPGWGYFVTSLLGAVLWPPITLAIEYPRRRAGGLEVQ